MVTQENLTNPQEKSNTVNPKKEVGKCYEFHKIPTHNTSEYQAKKSLVADIKDFESDAYSDTESKPEKGNDRGKKIIEAEPNTTILPRRSKRKN